MDRMFLSLVALGVLMLGVPPAQAQAPGPR